MLAWKFRGGLESMSTLSSTPVVVVINSSIRDATLAYDAMAIETTRQEAKSPWMD